MGDVGIKGHHTRVLGVILNKMKYRNQLYITPTQETLRNDVNQAAEQERSIRTLNYDLARLELFGLIERQQRTRKIRFIGRIFDSTLYKIPYKGLMFLHRANIAVFDIVKKIKGALNSKRAEPQRAGARGGSGESFSSLGEVLKGVVNSKKPL